MSEATASSLQGLTQATVAELTDVAAAGSSMAMEWSRAGIAFAAIDGDALEVRLAAPVARAALRTPDTQPSDRGTEWVRFTPAALDQYAVDRATAWVQSAWRNAGA